MSTNRIFSIIPDFRKKIKLEFPIIPKRREIEKDLTQIQFFVGFVLDQKF